MTKAKTKPNSENPNDYFIPGNQEYDYMCKMVSKEAINFSRNSTASFEDLSAEGYFGAVKALKKFNPESGNKFATYLYLNIKFYIQNESKRHLDTYGYQRTTSISALEEESDQDFVNELLIDNSSYDSIEMKDILSKLDPREEKILILKLEGYTDSEISEKVMNNRGKPLSRVSVSSIRHKATEKLKKYIEV